MAFWRSIGGLSTIVGGATVTWEIVYPPYGRDVGTVVMSPNIQQELVNTELIAFDQGVVARPNPGEGALPIHYTVKIRNAGASPISYNLNVGDWQ